MSDLKTVLGEAVEAAFAAEGVPADLARVTIYVRDLPNRSLETIRAVRDRYFTREQ